MALADRYEAILLDLDGVLYRGDGEVPGAPEAVGELRRRGRSVVFLTNNSARTPEQVADKLRGLGIDAAPGEVVTSAQATAQLLAREANGASAYVIGRDGIRTALEAEGIRVADDGEAAYVVVGWDGSVTYEDLRRATVLVRSGARLVATNSDASYPAPGGELWPGAGAILAAVETASGVRATVVGKPHRPLFDAALERAGSRNALMVGDRIETDIAGAAAAGIEAALVLTGAATAGDLLDHDPLPAAVLRDVGGLLLADVEPATPRRADEADLQAVRDLAVTSRDAPLTGSEGVWVLGDLDATATADVRGRDAYLRAVATRSERRASGLGTLAVAAAIGDARHRGASVAWLLTDTAAGFFAKLGFRPVERDDVPRWILDGPAEACEVSAVAMRRELGQ